MRAFTLLIIVLGLSCGTDVAFAAEIEGALIGWDVASLTADRSNNAMQGVPQVGTDRIAPAVSKGAGKSASAKMLQSDGWTVLPGNSEGAAVLPDVADPEVAADAIATSEETHLHGNVPSAPNRIAMPNLIWPKEEEKSSPEGQTATTSRLWDYLFPSDDDVEEFAGFLPGAASGLGGPAVAPKQSVWSFYGRAPDREPSSPNQFQEATASGVNIRSDHSGRFFFSGEEGAGEPAVNPPVDTELRTDPVEDPA